MAARVEPAQMMTKSSKISEAVLVINFYEVKCMLKLIFNNILRNFS
jgi:hypothetical protein